MLGATTGGFGGSKSSATRMGEIRHQVVQKASTFSKELDTVLGGGVVPGMSIILGGDAGIGKSTLSLQIAGQMSQNGKTVLYVSGEENQSQIKSRADRLFVDASQVIVLIETCLEDILKNCDTLKPDIVIIDSLQTTYSRLSKGVPGQIVQLKKVAQSFTQYAKTSNIPFVMIGHVTKAGGLAGPKTLEHIVDTVLYFEGKMGMSMRTLRSIKNRFGSVHEMGIFEMHEDGLHEVEDPSKMFLSAMNRSATGVCATPVIEGNKCILVEFQALISSPISSRGKSSVIGLDKKRVVQSLNVLEKISGAEITSLDISLNVAGDLSVQDSATDLAIIASVTSKYLDINISDVVFFGEVGLNGELRPVAQCPQRIKEAVRMGFKSIVLPESNRASEKLLSNDVKDCEGLNLIYFSNISEVIEFIIKKNL
jgi:DNA repair protein RadA/Sms